MWRGALSAIPSIATPSAQVSIEPPSVMLQYILGRDLDDLIRGGADDPVHLHRCGIALAAFHGHTSSTTRSTAPPQLATWRKRLLLPPRLDRRARPVLTAGDFTPYNLRVGEDGKLYVLDASSREQIVTLHRDLAWFLWWYQHDGGKYGRAFISGYEEKTGRQLVADDYRLIWLYFCVMSLTRARRKTQRRDYRNALRFTGWAIAARWRAGRRDGSFSHWTADR